MKTNNMGKIYTKIDGTYYPTNEDYCTADKLHFEYKVWAVTQAQYPHVKFIVKSINQDESCLLFFTDNKSICDAITEAYEKNFSIMCGMDQNNDCGEFQEGYFGNNNSIEKFP